VVSYQVAEIRPQVSGIIQSRLFKEGSYVEEGQQLYQIDPARYEADYQIATASLQNAKARRKNTQNLVTRYDRLLDSNAVSRQDYDDAIAGLDQARAAVNLAEAEVKSAKINLDYTRVYAPISGYISPSSVTRGALVTAQQELPLATVRQLDPVYVDLSKSAAEVRDMQERLAASRLNKESKPKYEVSLFLGNTGQTYPFKGTLDATDLAVDIQTGSIRLRSVFDNPDNILLPGMFVRASIEDIGRSKEIVIPQKSVKIDADGNKIVWTISADNKAVKTAVRTGVAYESNWIILDGLEAGDRLIVEGTMMLREGAPLKPENINTGNNQEQATGSEPDVATKTESAESGNTSQNTSADSQE
jgi:membrane fusion protein (multidrug efflux system)